MTAISIGTHNLHDEAGIPTFFASVVFFTESDPGAIREALPPGWAMEVCPKQRSLVIAWNKAKFRRRLIRPTGYARLVDGRAEVTPDRGTFIVYGRLHNGRKAALVVNHRINAAFPPYVRGEADFRREAWMKHAAHDMHVAKLLQDRGYVVLAGGDLNTPHGISGWKGVLQETGAGYDRLAASVPLSHTERLSPMGSDHARLRAVAQL